MRTKLKTLMRTAAVVTVLVGGPALYAYADTPNQGSSGMMGPGMMQGGPGGMMQGGQGSMTGPGGMMNMMGQMNQMMESCNKMMQSMTHEHGPKKPNGQWQNKESEKPEKKG